MKKKKMGKIKKSTIILSVVLSVVILATSILGVVALFYQPKATINDGTILENQGDGGTGEDPKPHGYVSQNVIWFDEKQSQEVNRAIEEIEGDSSGLYVTLESGTAVDGLGIGDIFYLEGNEYTPMGEPYFGKIKSIRNIDGKTHVSLENPTIDEVFDSIYFESGNVFTDGADVTVETVEGVSVVSGATPLNSTDESPKVSATKAERWKYTANDELKFDIEVDLLEAFKSKKETHVPNEEGSYTTRVYVLPNGGVYHTKDCRYVKAKSKEDGKKEIDLFDAVTQDYRACAICTPPILPDGEASAKPKLVLTGEVGIKNIFCEVLFDYETKQGLKNCNINVSGTAFGGVSVKGGAEMELGGLVTENTILKVAKIQGLKEKRFPLAYFSFTTQITCATATVESVRREVSTLPISVLVLAYFDINGNITFEVDGNFTVEREFNFNQTVVENGKANFKNDLTLADPEVDYNFHWGVEGDVDAHFGISLLIYVTNVNIVDVGIIKVGAEAEGALSFDISPKTLSGDAPICEGSIYVRGYLKLIDIDVRLKYQIDIGKVVNKSGEYTMSWTLFDFPIFTFGEKATTRYSRSMKLGKVTASDDDAIYYKDENGRLIRQVNDEMRIIYKEDFFVICAIDESYIYILKRNESGTLSMIRVSKEKGTNKEVLNDVKNVLCSDDENIYFSNNADPTIINKFNRGTEKVTQFCDFEDNVELMREQYAQFYIVTSSGYSFFGSSAEYFYIDKQGNITRELGSNPTVENLSITNHGNFNDAAMMVGSGYLRNTASCIYWMSANRSQHVLTECVSGWNPSKNVGIFTTLRNSDYSEGALPYKIVLYDAKDGRRRDVTTVNSDQAFFTLTQSDAGDWYFMDETSEYLILYTMDEDFSNKEELRRFSKSEINYSLTDCSMEIKDNCLYFFTIPDDSTCKVLKRYNIC